MKQPVTCPLRFGTMLLMGIFLTNSHAFGQCPLQVTHTTGTEQVGCTEVTVTQDGSVDVLTPNPCFYGPYWIGRYSIDGSYTFTFSPPIAGVTVDVQTLDNHDGHTEEMYFEVNGSFFPISLPGTTDNCSPPAIIWPPGVIRGDPNQDYCAWRNIQITTPISSLKIGNQIVSGVPAGFFASLYICCQLCDTDAGELTSSPLDVCPNQVATVPPSEQFILDGNDILQYIFFFDPGNITTSIIATSNTPQFTFNPATMAFGTTYHIAAIAGDEVGGNVSLTDPCLSISNAIDITWWPLPSVEFTTNFSCVNPGDCVDIALNFSGSPPFQLTGAVKSGNTVISTFSETFASSNAMLNVCLPANTAYGDVTIEATSLTDAHCICD
ncbi:MAG: hypothetical protein IT258_20465 [Saprospiraceae bacterium]|nr:hypothetical protein [Saprospiraceae bacterium]